MTTAAGRPMTALDLRLLRPRPVLLDANVLLNDLFQGMQRERDTVLTQMAVTGLLRPIAALDVLREVRQHLRRIAAQRGIDPETAELRFEARYPPVIHWVDTTELRLDDDPRIRRLTLRDPDDLPTAQLALLLGRRALSEDPDLASEGLGTGRRWLPSLLGVRTVAWTESAALASVIGIDRSLDGLGYVIAMLARAPRWVWPVLLASASMTALHPGLRAQAQSMLVPLGRHAMHLSHGIGGVALSAVSQHHLAVQEHDLLAIDPDPRAGDIAASVARLLATRRTPTSLNIVATWLPDTDPTLIARELCNPVFVRADGGWSLGSRGLPS